jgi:hypothetical protein
MSDAIYGRVQGAVYDSKNEWWTVPCGQMINLTFSFGGKAFPSQCPCSISMITSNTCLQSIPSTLSTTTSRS